MPEDAVIKPADVIVPVPVVVMFPTPDMFPVSVIVFVVGKMNPPFAVIAPVAAKVFPIVTVDVALPIEIGTTLVLKVEMLIAPPAPRDAF